MGRALGEVYQGLEGGDHCLPVLGGHVRVGLEDNLYLEKGVYGTNASLTERATEIIRLMGAQVASADEAREILGLNPRS